MSNIFHCAVCGGDLETTLPFYTDVLGCSLDNSEPGRWADVNFWGNELTLHQSITRTQCEYHNVEMGAVPVPHFGIHLERAEFDRVKQSIIDHKWPWVKSPFVRFAGLPHEQETFFVTDPAGNILEIKSLVNPGQGLSAG